MVRTFLFSSYAYTNWTLELFRLDLAGHSNSICFFKALFLKHPSYGLPEKLCNWINSFLADRSIKIVVDSTYSDLKSVNTGVPQGCVLSHILFLLHVNELLQTRGINWYADDST